MIVIFDILVYTFFHWKKRISSTWEEHNCGIIIRDINETKAKIFHTLYTLIHSQAMARVYSGGEKRIFDLRTRQGGGTEKRKSGRRDDTREMGERGGGLYIETAEDEGRRGGWESVLNTCFSYRVHFEAWSASFSLTSSPRLLLVAETQAASRVHTHIHTRTYTHTRARSPWFISLLNNSLLFSRPPLLGPQLPFDLSTPPPATSIHFYLRADALYPVLPFFFFFYSLRFLLFFGPHPLGIIIDVSSDATHAATF